MVSSVVKEEDVMSTSKKPLEPDDFPVTAEGQRLRSKMASP